MAIVFSSHAIAQNVDYVVDVPVTDNYNAPWTVGLQSGARAVNGPFDIDGDGLIEFLATDYTNGGRVHVIENKGADLWELVYSTPFLDSTNTGSYNARYASATNASADLDGDGRGEIILPTGRRFSATNPNYSAQGMYVFEYTGTDDDYGSAPASILELQDLVRVQANITTEDIDGDGTVELIFSNNGASAFDFWYVYSVTGDIGSNFEAWVQEWSLNPRDNSNAHGGGSATGVWPADLNGDGQKELLLNSWNSYNFLTATVGGADTYTTIPGNNLQVLAGIADAVAYAGGTVIDINGDGDDEVFLNSWNSTDYPTEHQLTLVNYEAGEDVSNFTADQIVTGLLPETFTWGLTSGDLDGDGNPEVMGVGSGYSSADATAGLPAKFVRIAEYVGGQGSDPENPANYQVSWLETNSDLFRAGFDTVNRDSAGVTSSYIENSGIFAFRAAYLGDADGDGANEMVIGFQGVRDSVDTYSEVWNADSTRYDRTLQSRAAATARPFAAVLSSPATGVATAERIVVPSDYKLSTNYPNPFNPTTSFSITLPIDKTVSVRIYDITGRLVRTLAGDQYLSAGTYEFTWDGTADSGQQVASGTYLYALEYGNFRQAKTMVLLK